MNLSIFYISAFIALASTLLTITRTNAAHALLYLVVSLLAVAVIFYQLGAPMAAALEVIVYAGAIMVLFVFVIMMLNQGKSTQDQEAQWLATTPWKLPALFCTVLLVELFTLIGPSSTATQIQVVDSKTVGVALFGPYLLAVELASMLLLAGLIGAYHLGRAQPNENDQQPSDKHSLDHHSSDQKRQGAAQS